MSEWTWNLFLSVLTLLLTKQMYNLSVKVTIWRFYCFLGDDNTLYTLFNIYLYIEIMHLRYLSIPVCICVY